MHLVAYGSGKLEVHLQSMSCNLEFHVIDKPVTPLLGLMDSLSLNLIQLHSEVHEVDTTDAFRAAILDKYKDLFQGDLGNIPVVYKMRLDANVTLVIRPSCRIPLAMEESVKRELDRMVKNGAITPMSEPTEWVSQMVAVKKKDGSIRIGITSASEVFQRVMEELFAGYPWVFVIKLYVVSALGTFKSNS